MRAHARIVAERRDGRTVYPVLRSDPPLTLRRAAGDVYVVGSAAGPLAGDRTAMDVEVGAGTDVTVRGVAASILLAGPRSGPSRAEVTATLGTGARLRWLPEPAVVTARADHVAVATIRLAGGTRLVWREELLLGRENERPGRLSTRLRVDLDGEPLLRSDLALGDADDRWRSPAIIGDHRAVGQCLLVGGPLPDETTIDDGDLRLAVTRLAGPAALVIAVARSGMAALRAALDTTVAATATTASSPGLPPTPPTPSAARA